MFADKLFARLLDGVCGFKSFTCPFGQGPFFSLTWGRGKNRVVQRYCLTENEYEYIKWSIIIGGAMVLAAGLLLYKLRRFVKGQIKENFSKRD